jgi:hypothetical protein
MPTSFASALTDRDLNKALGIWSHIAEGLLVELGKKHAPISKGNDDTESKCNTRGRGKIRIEKRTTGPATVGDTAYSRDTAAIQKAINRCKEVALAVNSSFRREKTWHAVAVVQPFLLTDLAKDALLQAQRQQPSTDNALKLAGILQTELGKVTEHAKRRRLKNWRVRVRQHEADAYKWAAGGATKQQGEVLKRADGTYTSNSMEQLDLVLEAWRPIFERFKAGEPSKDEFFREFGPHMRTHEMGTDPISGEMLRETLVKMKNNAAGLDQWAASDLKILLNWHPELFDDLAEILNVIEDCGRWPDAMVQGFVSLIPKDASDPEPTPTSLRPITILSAVYRLWARSRFDQAMDTWQELWVLDNVWGCRRKRGAEGLFLGVALDLDEATNKILVGGVSYDFAKAFDYIPQELLFGVLRHRGLSERILKPLEGMYGQLTRMFKLQGKLGATFKSYGGILQGCALSMLALNALVSCWIECVRKEVPGVIPRAYADDISATVKAKTQKLLKKKLKEVHAVTTKYEKATGGEVSAKKSYTFGNDCLKDTLGGIDNHLESFRLVGGSLTTAECGAKHTELESTRIAKWRNTVQKVRRFPGGWFTKVKMMRATSSQAHWGQGTHTLPDTPIELQRLRTEVLKSLWNMDKYSTSPGITLTILAPVGLDPLFQFMYQGLCTLWRTMQDPHERAKVAERYRRDDGGANNGPIARLKQIAKHQHLKPAVDKLMDYDNLDAAAWRHELRESWRQKQWEYTARTRPKYAGIEKGVDRAKTTAFLSSLQEDADLLQCDIDINVRMAPVIGSDPRAKVVVLRKLVVCIRVIGWCVTPEVQVQSAHIVTSRRPLNMFHGHARGILLCALQHWRP